MKTLNTILFGAALAVGGLCSCEHKDLCYHHPHSAAARIDVDWTDFAPFETPTGMSVMVYPEDGDEPMTLLSNDITHVDVPLYEGHYRVLAYNQSPSEFGMCSFENMENFESAMVKATTYESRWYETRTGMTRVADEPEWLGCDSREEVYVPDSILSDGQTHVVATLRPQDIVYNVRVNIKAEGSTYVRSVRASLTGLAEGYMLGLLTPTSTTVTQLMESWKRTRVTRTRGEGDSQEEAIVDSTLSATIKSFGLPTAHKAQAADNVLTVTILLVDGKTKLSHDFLVGDLFKLSDTEPMTYTIDIAWPERIPYVRAENSSFFDVTVDDWGEESNIDLITK